MLGLEPFIMPRAQSLSPALPTVPQVPGVRLERDLEAAAGERGDARARARHHAEAPVLGARVARGPQVAGVGLEGDLEAAPGQGRDAGARARHHAELPVGDAVGARGPQVGRVGLEGDLGAGTAAGGGGGERRRRVVGAVRGEDLPRRRRCVSTDCSHWPQPSKRVSKAMVAWTDVAPTRGAGRGPYPENVWSSYQTKFELEAQASPPTGPPSPRTRRRCRRRPRSSGRPPTTARCRGPGPPYCTELGLTFDSWIRLPTMPAAW